jgi:hypothetical protein
MEVSFGHFQKNHKSELFPLVTQFLQLSISLCQHRKLEKQSSFSLSHHQAEFRNDPEKATLIIPQCLTVYHRKTENEV